MKSDYKVRARKFIQDIFPYIEENLYDNNAVQLCEKVRVYNFKKHRKVILTWGMSRRVLISSDYVIKWDYRDSSFCGDSEDELFAWEFIKKTPYSYLFVEISKVEYAGKIFYIMPKQKGIDAGRDEVEEYLTDEEKEFVTDYFSDIHSENFAIWRGKVRIFDYAWNNVN